MIIERTLCLRQYSYDFFYKNGGGKKMYMDEVSSAALFLLTALMTHILTQNGWPSKTSDGVQPNSPSAVANVANEKVRFKTDLILPDSSTLALSVERSDMRQAHSSDLPSPPHLGHTLIVSPHR